MRKFELLRTDADLPQNSKICVAVHITRGPTGIELLALWEKSPSHERGLTEPTEERVPLSELKVHAREHGVVQLAADTPRFSLCGSTARSRTSLDLVSDSLVSHLHLSTGHGVHVPSHLHLSTGHGVHVPVLDTCADTCARKRRTWARRSALSSPHSSKCKRRTLPAKLQLACTRH